MKKIGVLVGGVLLAVSTALASPANAIPFGPNSCVSGGFGGFGQFTDCDLWADGSFWHEQYGGFIGYGGWSARVCDGVPPVPTDSDPNTPCPGVVMP